MVGATFLYTPHISITRLCFNALFPSNKRDIDDEHVRKVFHEVAVECVSFCGVDVNVASFDLLRYCKHYHKVIAQNV